MCRLATGTFTGTKANLSGFGKLCRPILHGPFFAPLREAIPAYLTQRREGAKTNAKKDRTKRWGTEPYP